MYDAVVVGAGLPGLMAAWRLASGGLKVAVFERRTIAAESSALAAGHVPQSAYAPSTLEILQRTRRLVETLDQATGSLIRYERVGGLSLATTSSNRALFEGHVKQLSTWGVASELLEPAEIRRRWPEISVDDVEAAFFSPEDGFVRSLDLTVALAAKARNAGAAVYEGSPVERIDIADGAVRGVVVGGDRVVSSRAVLAAGGWSLSLARASGLSIPLKLFTLSIAMLVGVPFALPFLDEVERRFYTISRTPGTLLLGLPPVVARIAADSFPRKPDPVERARFVDMLRARVPALHTARVSGGWAGLLVATPDGYPMLGEHPDIEGLYVATGFGGAGLQRVTAAEAVAQEILGEAPFFDMSLYHIRRFAAYDGADFEFEDGLPYFYGDQLSGRHVSELRP